MVLFCLSNMHYKQKQLNSFSGTGEKCQWHLVMCNCPACWIAGFGCWEKHLAVCADFSQGWHWTSVNTAYGPLSNERFPVSRAVWVLSPIAKLPLKGFQKAVYQSGKVRLSCCTVITVRVVGTTCLPTGLKLSIVRSPDRFSYINWVHGHYVSLYAHPLNAQSQVQTWTLSGFTLLSEQGPWGLNPSRGSV